MRVSIRDYRPDDFDALKKLWDLTGMGQSERKDSAGVIERCNRMGGKLLVMVREETGEIMGSSWMTRDGRRVYLHHFGILPAYQHRGFGTMLAERSLKWIREKGEQVKMEVHRENLAAKHLYERLGFFSYQDYEIYMLRDVNRITE